VARLQTKPGVGTISAQTLVAAVDTIDRFPSAKKLVGQNLKDIAPKYLQNGWRH
jgi:hypothetical protein